MANDCRYVAYFDMLGFKKALERDHVKAWGALSDLQACMESVLKESYQISRNNETILACNRVKGVIFSDTIMFFTLKDQLEDLLAILFCSTKFFTKSLASCIPLQGGISHGNFSFNFDKQLYCGEPLVKACKIAESPQWTGIVVDEKVAEIYNAENLSINPPLITEWTLELRDGQFKKSWVINWPQPFRESFTADFPITSEQYYRAFESLYGKFDKQSPWAQKKYDNTVFFINSILGCLPKPPSDNSDLNLKDQCFLKYQSYLADLGDKAIKKNPFEFICTLLRVSGCEDSNWDTLAQAKETLKNFNRYLQQAFREEDYKAANNMGLVIYCYLVEMTFGYELLLNTLRCINGQKYTMWPFLDDIRSCNKKHKKPIPLSAKTKFKKIKDLAQQLNEARLVSIIDEVFNDEILYAVSRADYIITDEYFRMREGGFPRQIELKEIDELVYKCFAFYDALLFWQNKWLETLAERSPYSKHPNYEVLELLSENGRVNGFALHFSNGHKASFSRSGKSELVNIIINNDGTISPTCGRIDLLENKWKIEGKLAEEFGQNYNKL